MFGRIRVLYIRYARYFSMAFFAALMGVWFLGPVFLGAIPASASYVCSFAIMLAFLSLMSERLDDLGAVRVCKVFENQYDNNTELHDFLYTNSVKHAKMIEYDADSVRPILVQMLTAGTKVDLLLQHPDEAISEHQRDRILAQIRGKVDLPNHKRLNVAYYKDIASIRGRKFDEKYFSIGWYTYDRRRYDGRSRQVTGDVNPVMTFSLEYAEGRVVCDMFDEVFKNLAKHSECYDDIASRL